jgi:hypothetical protein
MGKDPAFLFYYQDFLVGSDHMSLEQVGGYIKCLCHQAARYTIKESHMRNLVGSQDNFIVIREKFILDTNKELFNPRLREEMEKRKKFTQSRLNNLHKGDRMGKHMGAHVENENEDEIVIKNKDKNKVVFTPPGPEEIKAYCQEARIAIDVPKFIDFYQSKGWMVGKTKMRDWKASVRNWHRSEKGTPTAKKWVEETPRRKPEVPFADPKVAALISETAQKMR